MTQTLDDALTVAGFRWETGSRWARWSGSPALPCFEELTVHERDVTILTYSVGARNPQRCVMSHPVAIAASQNDEL